MAGIGIAGLKTIAVRTGGGWFLLAPKNRKPGQMGVYGYVVHDDMAWETHIESALARGYWGADDTPVAKVARDVIEVVPFRLDLSPDD